MIHRGKILKAVIKKLRTNQSKLAADMGISRRTVYLDILKEDLSLEKLINYGKALRYDFSKEVPELNLLVVSMRDPGYNQGPVLSYGDMEKDRNYWKDKYIELLEKHSALLEERQKEPGELKTNGSVVNV